MNNKKIDFTEGKIFKKLILFSVPIILALLLQAAYGAVDLIVVGQFGTSADTSGVGTGSQLMHTITQVISGFAMATTVLLGQKIGQKQREECSKIIGTSAIFFFVVSIIVTIIMIFIARPFCIIMRAPSEAFEETLDYVRTCSIGLVFIIAYNVLGSICRGTGDSTSPLITVAISAIINVGLDLLFCAVFKLGANGAAIATVVSQGISCCIMLVVLFKNNKLGVKITKSDLKANKNYIKQILKLGFPISLQDGLVGISFLFITAMINDMGVNPSAGVACAEKVVAFIMLIPSAFAQALSAFVAQNAGANMHERGRKALFYGISASFCCAVMLFSLSFFKGQLLASIFSNDVEVQVQAALYLKSYAIDTFLTSFMFCFVGYFNGYGKTAFVMIQGVLSAFLIRIPVSFVMSKLENTNLFLIGLATPSSTFIQIIMCVVYYCIVQKQINKEVTIFE